jgi:hypothetical protein
MTLGSHSPHEDSEMICTKNDRVSEMADRNDSFSFCALILKGIKVERVVAVEHLPLVHGNNYIKLWVRSRFHG